MILLFLPLLLVSSVTSAKYSTPDCTCNGSKYAKVLQNVSQVLNRVQKEFGIAEKCSILERKVREANPSSSEAKFSKERAQLKEQISELERKIAESNKKIRQLTKSNSNLNKKLQACEGKINGNNRSTNGPNNGGKETTEDPRETEDTDIATTEPDEQQSEYITKINVFKTPVTSKKAPYWIKFPRDLTSGNTLEFSAEFLPSQGSSDSNDIVINLAHEPRFSELHQRLTRDGRITFDVQSNDKYHNDSTTVEHGKSWSVPQGDKFRCRIRVNATGFEIRYNGHFIHFYKHRLPASNIIQFLWVQHNVKLIDYRVQEDMAVPYTRKFTKPFKFGDFIYINGITRGDFGLLLKDRSGALDDHLQFLIASSLIKRQYSKKKASYKSSLMRDVEFEILIINKAQGLEYYVNGQLLAPVIPHKIHSEEVYQTLVIEGEVDLFEVSRSSEAPLVKNNGTDPDPKHEETTTSIVPVPEKHQSEYENKISVFKTSVGSKKAPYWIKLPWELTSGRSLDFTAKFLFKEITQDSPGNHILINLAHAPRFAELSQLLSWDGKIELDVQNNDLYHHNASSDELAKVSIVHGDTFRCRIRVNDTGFEIRYNGHFTHFYKHRLPTSNIIKFLWLEFSVQLIDYRVQEEMAVPYTRKFTEPLKFGDFIYINGITRGDFGLLLKDRNGALDDHLQFSIGSSKIVRQYSEKKTSYKASLKRDVEFEILIITKSNGLEYYINGQLLKPVIPHKTRGQEVYQSLVIEGEVDLFEVSRSPNVVAAKKIIAT